MCDYSLDLVASRPAKVGDELVTMKFQNSMTRGFAAANPGTTMLLNSTDAKRTGRMAMLGLQVLEEELKPARSSSCHISDLTPAVFRMSPDRSRR